jgi:hypothetical protein
MATTRRKGSWAVKVAAIALAVVIGVDFAKKKISSGSQSTRGISR